MLTLRQVDEVIKDVFNETLVKSVETVYQKSDEGYLLVISIHGLELDDTIILHTKFIFPVNEKKTGLNNNHFTYLANMGCGYKYVEFDENSVDDLKEKIFNILDNNRFDDELREISDFLGSAPDTRINNYLYDKGEENISCHEVRYNPKFKITPCTETTYDFIININDSYEVHLSIQRQDPKAKLSPFNLSFKLFDIHTSTCDSMVNIGEVIGQELINIFNSENIL